MDSTQSPDMIRPPICRGMRSLDRSFFKKTVPLKAARVSDNKNISKIRSELLRSKDCLQLERLANVLPDPDASRAALGKKCILLRPEGQTEQNSSEFEDTNQPTNPAWPHSSTLSEFIHQQLVTIIPYDLKLDYKYWTYHDIISAILPEDEQGEIPSGFSQVGHVAHLNLREEYLPYKHIIAEIISDKNPGVQTVINKIDDVGEESEYRTFRYEVLAGPDEMNVEVSEENCIFRFDYSKVYWNTRLQNEHRRLVSLFKEGEAVCDLMAGVGPFAVPAGKKRVFVWANDLNPDSYECLKEAIKINKVSEYVRPFNEDGRTFAQTATARLLNDNLSVTIRNKVSRREQKPGGKNTISPNVVRTIAQPKTFQHFVLNLPASALSFLPSFIGLYPASVRHQIPDGTELPLIHVYCFSTKDELMEEEADAESAEHKICAEISKQLQHPMKPGKSEEGGVEIYDVRDVAPKKRMFCATFRLPADVAFRDPS